MQETGRNTLCQGLLRGCRQQFVTEAPAQDIDYSTDKLDRLQKECESRVELSETLLRKCRETLEHSKEPGSDSSR